MENDLPIEKLGLKHRTYMVLKRMRLNTVGAVLTQSKDEIFSIRGMGSASFDDLVTCLKVNGIEPDWD